MLSSPELYAQALNMTIEEVKEQKKRHRLASQDLHIALQEEGLTGKEKHEIMCQHRLKYGRHPFVCPDCWSYMPVCVCSMARKQQSRLGKQLQVVVWTHHKEWGLTSNTGSILSLTIPDFCHLLMKGLPDHDRILEEFILQDKESLVVVLWPNQSKATFNEKTSGNSSLSISLEQVQREIKDNKRVFVIAVDGTWRNARRMVARLPPFVRRLDLPEDVVYSYVSDDEGDRSSILSPLRNRGKSGELSSDDENKRQVCTVEAVVGALTSLGAVERDQGIQILDVARTKVDRISRYRGKVVT
jgi:DTW domain-containing protein YfiP